MRPSPWASSKCANRSRDVRDDDRLAPLDQLAGRIVGPPPVEAMSEQLVEVRKAVAADDHHLVAVELLDAGSSIGHDLAQLREDQVEDLGHAQRAAERLGRRAQRLGLFAGGALGFEQPSVLDRHRGLGGECRRELRQLLVVEVRLELVDADDADRRGRRRSSGHRSIRECVRRRARWLAKCGWCDTSAKTCGRFDRTTWIPGLVSSSRSKPTPIIPPRSSKPRPLTITRRFP